MKKNQNSVYYYFQGTILFLFVFFMPFKCYAQVFPELFSEEMQILKMYYDEKALVVTASRHPKSISRVAENMTVITAKEIEKINAHSIAQVLNRVPGIILDYNQDFGSSSFISIQGCAPKHVRVLLDGVTWNFLGSGLAEINSIPVGIIKRIEIIKGPGSSAWGSSLGGVINIITKSTCYGDKTYGMLKTSYGERNTQDYSAEIAGPAGHVKYYFFGGYQKSDGLRNQRDFETYNLFSKVKIPVYENISINISLACSEPDIDFGEFESMGISSKGETKTLFSNASINAAISKNLNINFSLHYFKQKSILETTFPGNQDFFIKDIYDEDTTGCNANLAWSGIMHTAVFGFDFDHGDLDQTNHIIYGINMLKKTDPHIEKWAFYANDTIIIDNLSITPGIRYDHNSETGSFISPSLGTTYKIGRDSVLRGTVARGFTIPPLSYTSGGGFGSIPNPALDPEEVWSYQAGVESTAFRFFWIKASLFYHNIKKTFKLVSLSQNTGMMINGEKTRRKGFEIESETISFYNMSLQAGFALSHSNNSHEDNKVEQYTYNLGFKYDDKKSFYALLSGHYIWWGNQSRNGQYDDFIWDLNLNKKIISESISLASTELFCSIHNIFNGSQYSVSDNKNPKRWLEAGLRFKF